MKKKTTAPRTAPAPHSDRTAEAVKRGLTTALAAVLGLTMLAQVAEAAPRTSEDQARPGSGRHWVATWYAAPQQGKAVSDDQSYRMIVHTALGGSRVRLRFSNRYGTTPLKLRNVHVALPVRQTSALQEGTQRRVAFDGKRTVTVPPGRDRRSDPLAFDLPSDGDVAISFDVPGRVPSMTHHAISLGINWRTQPGDGGHAGHASGSAYTVGEMPWSFATGLDVLKPRNVTTVVALDDSITDGAFSEPNGNTRWPDLLNDRISTSPWRELRSVVNAGISGNMVTADRDGNALQGQAAVTRMAWDVLSQPGVSHLVVFEGINDVGEGVSGPQIVRGLRSIIQRARKRGITVVLGTLTPSYGAYVFGAPYHENQAPRDEVNRWVRSRPASTRLVDFSSAVATSTRPEAWQATLTVDFLHPNPIGMRVMANAFPIAALR